MLQWKYQHKRSRKWKHFDSLARNEDYIAYNIDEEYIAMGNEESELEGGKSQTTEGLTKALANLG